MKILTALAGAALALTLGLSAADTQATKATKAQATKAEATQASAADEKAMIAEQRMTYPLTTCLVSGEALGEMGDVIEKLVDGRLVRLCCKGCVKGFKKDPAASFAKIDQAVVKAQAASYPSKTCLVSGEAMEDPVDIVHGTRLVRLCCKGCVKAYKKDPAAIVAKLDAAYVTALKPKYKSKKCLVSGEDLGSMGEPVDMMYGNTLVRLCCKGCVKGFKKDPAKYIAKLDAKPGAAGAKKVGAAKKAGEVRPNGAGQ